MSAPLPSYSPGIPRTEAADLTEDLTETEGREIGPMVGTETGKTIEIGQVMETEKTEGIIEIDHTADMTGIIIMIGTEEEGEGMDFSKQNTEA